MNVDEPRIFQYSSLAVNAEGGWTLQMPEVEDDDSSLWHVSTPAPRFDTGTRTSVLVWVALPLFTN